MRALGELVLHRPTSGAFVSYMREFFGEKAAFVTGWLYWLNWGLTGIAELSAVGLYVQFWIPDDADLGDRADRAGRGADHQPAVGQGVRRIRVLGLDPEGRRDRGLPDRRDRPGARQDGRRRPRGRIPEPVQQPGRILADRDARTSGTGPILVMSGVVFAYAAIEMVGVAAGEMEDSEREVPKAVNAVIFRIGIFYCGSILLLVSILPTTEYTAGTSPFVTVFERLGLTWMSALIQAILIVAAMSSLNSGLYSTGRVLRSLGMSKQAPKFTLKMSSSGVPWAGIVMTSVVFVFGAVLNFLVPDAFELALEAAAIGVVFTWGTIFVCQLRLRKLVNLGVIPKSKFQAPGYPWTSYIGLAFLALVIVGMAISGWQASPYFWHKTDFIVVVFGIPLLAICLTIGWMAVRKQVIENTGGRIKAVWSETGPTYGADVSPDDLDPGHGEQVIPT